MSDNAPGGQGDATTTETVWRDRGLIIAGLTAFRQAIEDLTDEHAECIREGTDGDLMEGCSLLIDLRAALASSAPASPVVAPSATDEGGGDDDDDRFRQCPHEAIRATCPLPCNCGCSGCAALGDGSE